MRARVASTGGLSLLVPSDRLAGTARLQLIAEGDLRAAHLLVDGAGPAPIDQIQVERFRAGRIAEHRRATGTG